MVVTVALLPSLGLAAFELRKCGLEQPASAFLLRLVAADVASLPGAPSPPSLLSPLPGGGGGGVVDSASASLDSDFSPSPPTLSLPSGRAPAAAASANGGGRGEGEGDAAEFEEGTRGGAVAAAVWSALLLSPRPVLSVPLHLRK